MDGTGLTFRVHWRAFVLAVLNLLVLLPEKESSEFLNGTEITVPPKFESDTHVNYATNNVAINSYS